MLILGILLVIVALVVFGFLFLGTSDLEPLQIDLGIFTVELTPLHLFLLGAATLVLLVLGLLFLSLGLRASRRRRLEVKELRKEVERRPAPDPMRADPAIDRTPPRTAEVAAPGHEQQTAPTSRQHREGAARPDEEAGPFDRTVSDGPADSSQIDSDTTKRPVDLPADHRDDPGPRGPRRA